MRTRIENLVEQYVNKEISVVELVRHCNSVEEACAALEQAEYSKSAKTMQIQASWKEQNDEYQDFLQEEYYWGEAFSYNYWDYHDWNDFMENDSVWAPIEAPKFTEEQLQEAFDKFNEDRRKAIRRIAKEARWRGITKDTVIKFMNQYALTDSERTVFWMYYLYENL